MNEKRRYEIQGTLALACGEERERVRNIIDYDVARRSFEARQRLAQRRERIYGEPDHVRSSIARRNAEQSLQSIVEESYTPGRSLIDAIRGLAHQAVCAIAAHPFALQLKYGSLRGRPMQGATYRQVFKTTVACVALCSVMVFVGA